jgi:hypothetical protein
LALLGQRELAVDLEERPWFRLSQLPEEKRRALVRPMNQANTDLIKKKAYLVVLLLEKGFSLLPQADKQDFEWTEKMQRILRHPLPSFRSQRSSREFAGEV